MNKKDNTCFFILIILHTDVYGETNTKESYTN
jgi:hypothetical protein